MNAGRRAFASILLTLSLAGSVRADDAVAPTTAPSTILIHLPGIGGELRIDHNLIAGLKAGGVTNDAIIHDWTGSDRGLNSLGNVGRHRGQAQIVAAKIRFIARTQPNARIILIAHSGGTGIAVWALEDLPPDVHIDTLVLLASALSPTYDLSKALTHVSGHAFSFYSSFDEMVLGVGTKTFGTIDRVKTEAAGYIGFKPPAQSDPKQYAKLQQVPYDQDWMKLGNAGEHIGTMAPLFARDVLAPMIIESENAHAGS